ncbi:MAG: DUF5359 family protein [Bacillus sp. (in: firmicutes)]
MKKVERIIIKLAIIQLFFLLFFQLVVHDGDTFLELKRLAEYEGVYRDNHEVIIDVLNNRIQLDSP